MIVPDEEPAELSLRSIPDGATFPVSRSDLAKSQVFQDMLASCDPQAGGATEVLDMAETASAIDLLLTLLRSPPEPTTESEPSPPLGEHANDTAAATPTTTSTDLQPDMTRRKKIIPLPVIEQLLSLADKYMLSQDIVDALHTHVRAQARTSPLRVYGLASALRLPKIAAAASAYLLDPPLDTYTLEEIRENIPDLAAYHRLVRLQAVRARRLKEVLVGEELFPHGYGRCDAHDNKSILVWEQRKQRIAWRIHAGTDVASEMAEVMQFYEGCTTCSKAGEAAIEMLRYKCNRCPRRTSHLPV